jgi:hypothetical protein
VTYLRPIARGRLVANGFSAPWTFFPFALLAALVVLNILGSELWKWPSSTLPYVVDPACVVVLALCWYFWVARIPDWIRLRQTRKEVPEAIVTSSARATRSLLVWFAELRRAQGGQPPSSWGIVLVATRLALQFWMTVDGESALVGSLDWSELERIRVDPSDGSRILIRRDGDTGDLAMRALNSRWFRPVIVRGVGRARLVAQLETLRSA